MPNLLAPNPAPAPVQRRMARLSPPAFDDPDQFTIRPDVPVLGLRPADGIDERALHLYAKNGNRRAQRTGNYPMLLLGHTTDHTPQHKQPPCLGYARHFSVGDLNGRPVLLVDFAIKKGYERIAAEHPHRSAEAWDGPQPAHRVIDHISLLKTSPRFDLGMITRYDRTGDTLVRMWIPCPGGDCDCWNDVDRALTRLRRFARALDLGCPAEGYVRLLRFARAIGADDGDGRILRRFAGEDCGTGAGGFKQGNTCAAGGKLYRVPKDLRETFDVTKEEVREDRRYRRELQKEHERERKKLEKDHYRRKAAFARRLARAYPEEEDNDSFGERLRNERAAFLTELRDECADLDAAAPDPEQDAADFREEVETNLRERIADDYETENREAFDDDEDASEEDYERAREAYVEEHLSGILAKLFGAKEDVEP